MDDSRPTVRMVADELGDHLPVWFPSPIFDDVTQMPISDELIAELRNWNRVGQDVRESGDISVVTEHYRVGRNLAQQLAAQLDPDYEVHFLMGGSSGTGWTRITPSD